MKSRVAKCGGRQTGVAAVEFALILPLLVLLLAVTLFFGRFFWHYTVAQKAAHDAAVILAGATRLEIGASNADLDDVPVAALARAVIEEEIAELNPGLGRPRIEIYCDGLACVGDGVPQDVRVVVRMRMFDIFFGGFTGQFGGNDGLWLRADVRMPYVGN